jgi:uncharacterized protein with HEPN domain
MSKKTDSVGLLDMLAYARKVSARLEDVALEQWNSDETLRSAVAYWIQTIGEAASKLSAEFCNAHPEIDWLGIINMRHRIVHGYALVESDKIWQTATTEVPELIALLEHILAR